MKAYIEALCNRFQFAFTLDNPPILHMNFLIANSPHHAIHIHKSLSSGVADSEKKSSSTNFFRTSMFGHDDLGVSVKVQDSGIIVDSESNFSHVGNT